MRINPGVWTRILLAFFWVAIGLVAQTQVSIGSISFEGNKSFDLSTLQNLFMSSPGKAYVPESLASDLRHLEEFYHGQGFLRARVGPPEVEIQQVEDKKIARIRIPVSEGLVFTLAEASVRGAQAVSAETLLQMCPLAKGKPYSRAKAAEWEEKIDESYRSLGYLRFGCAPRENVNDREKTVSLILDCTEGNPYVVGKLSVVGDPSINQLEFKRRLLVSEGGIFNPEMLSTSIYYLNQMRVYRPIAASDVEMKIDDEKGTVDLIWHLVVVQKPSS
jgi:outer membrane protein insertion porin family